MPQPSEYDNPAYNTVHRVYNQGHMAPFDNPGYDPPLKAYNDICTITSHYHTLFMKWFEDECSSLYDFAAWAVGMPEQTKFTASGSAVIVVNAGAG